MSCVVSVESEVHFQEDWCVVLAGAGVYHFGPDYPILDPLTDQEIVNPPAGVVDFAGLHSLGPPRIDCGDISVDMAEGISEAGVKQEAEALSLFICKAW